MPEVPVALEIWRSIRALAKARAFTLVALLVLTLGIAVNTAVFSGMNMLLFRPLPFPDGDRLVVLTEVNAASGRAPVSWPAYLEWKQRARSYTALAAFQLEGQFDVGGNTGEPERVGGVHCSAGLLPMLSAAPIRGRTFTEAEEDAGGVVLISENLWRRKFAARPDIAGQQFLLDGRATTILGVLPSSFRILYGNQDVWMPLAADRKAARTDRGILVLGRLKAGVEVRQADAEAKELARALATRYPETNGGWTAQAVPLRKLIMAGRQNTVSVLLVTVFLVMLIACANISSLQLARAAARRHDVAVCLALGARRWRLARQFLVESALLATAGAGLALIALQWIRNALAARVPELREFVIDLRVLAFTLAMLLLATLAFGLVPSLAGSRASLNEVLRAGGRTGAPRSHTRGHQLLAGAELTLSVMLVIGAVALLSAFYRLNNAEPGYRTQGVAMLEFRLPPARYREPRQQIAFAQRALEAVRAVPGVQHAAVANALPLAGITRARIEPEAGTGGSAAALDTGFRIVSPGYFATLGIPLLRGRGFLESDNFSAPRVAIVNDALRLRLSPKGEVRNQASGLAGAGQAEGLGVVGRRIRLEGGEWLTVVGVAGNIRNFLIAEPDPPEVCVPMLQHASRDNVLFVAGVDPDRPSLVRGGLGWRPGSAGPGRDSSAQPRFVASVTNAVRQLDPHMPVAASMLDELLFSQTVLLRFISAFVAALAVLALLLASAGLWGTVSYGVEQRTREIGIRVALGATRWQAIGLVLRGALLLTVASVSAGMALGFALTRLLAAFLQGIRLTDALPALATGLVLGFVALAACYIPARRAARVDPAVALRYE